MTTIGRVQFDVDFDGRTLPRQARRIGQQAGNAMGEATSRSFNRRFVNASRGLRVAFARLSRDIVRNTPALNGLTTAFRDMATSIVVRALPSLFSVAGAIDRAGDAFQRARTRIGDSARNTFNRVAAGALGAAYPSLVRLGEGMDRLAERTAPALAAFRRFGARIRSTLPDFAAMRPAVNGVGTAFRRFGTLMRRSAQDSGVLEGGLKVLDKEIRQKGTDVDRTGRSFGRFRTTMVAANRDSKSFFGTWKNLPHGFRQATFYVALFASLGSQISALGSAAGSSLVVLGSSIVALLPAIAVLAIGISGITGDLADVPEGARAAAEAIRALAVPFKELQQNVTVALFSGLEGSISALATGLIPTLNAGLVLTAQTLNGVLANMLAFVNSTGFLETLAAVFVTIQPIITNLLNAFGQLGVALGTIFVASLPTVQIFSERLLELFTTFAEWTSSLAGQNSLAEFFENGRIIMDAVLPLLGAAGQLLNNLVTPETVALLVGTLNNLTEFMPALGTLLGAIAIADPIGLIALALNELGKAMAPAAPVLLEIGETINGILVEAITTLAPLIGELVVGFAPLVLTLLQLAGSILSAVLPALQPLIAAIVALVPAVMPLVQSLSAALLPVIAALVPVIIDLVASLLPIIAEILPVFVELVELLTPILLQLTEILVFLIPIIGEQLGSAVIFVTDILDSLMGVIEGVLQTLGGLLDFIIGVFTGDWERAWKGISDIVAGQMNTVIGIVEGALNLVIGLINNLIRGANAVSGAIGLPAIPEIAKAYFPRVAFAAGGIVSGPMSALIGEAGPEAVVPLNRPLGAVNPDVRGISALLQGKSLPGSAGSSGPSVIVEDGAIRIEDVSDGRQAASAALDRLVARLAG